MGTTTGQPGAPRLVIGPAARTDLDLHGAGIALPWRLLGGSVHDPGDGGDARDVAIAVHDDLFDALEASSELLLTDATHLPVGRMSGLVVTHGDGPGSARGELTPLGTPTDASWRHPARQLVIVQRPLLAGEASRILAAIPGVAGAGAEDRPVVTVLVPSGPTPDGIPSSVLQGVIEASLEGHPGVVVTQVPISWRDEASDAALVQAIARGLTSPVELLPSSDEGWRTALKGLASGQVGPELEVPVASQLLRWRPPPAERGVVILFTGLSGSGKSSLASALTAHLRRSERRTVTLLDGDLVRHLLSSGLGFDRASRDLNVRRIGYVAAEVARHHGMAVCAPIAPYASSRDAVREMVQPLGDFVLIHVATPLAECERRDRKGLYARARAGEVPEFTGISSPYEAPTDADLVIDTTDRTLEESLDLVLNHLRSRGWLTP